jgi:tetratricopeptide (TPR) repeat protein
MAVAIKSRATTLGMALVLSALCALAAPLACQAQGSASPTKKPCNTTPCPATPDQTKKPPPAQEFPYPGEPAKVAPAKEAPEKNVDQGPSSLPASPDAPAASPSKLFPYPGEVPQSPTQRQESSSSNSGSSDSGASTEPNSNTNADPDIPAAESAEKSPRRRLPKVKNLQSDEDRAAEDVTVARYYLDRGNWNAAYLRSKDAVQHQPSDPDAHLLLAESAQKLDKRDEAIAEYNSLFKLDASDDQLKTAHKGLARLQ